VGVGDENTEMFKDRDWQQLKTRIARYIVPYDAAAQPSHPYWLTSAGKWIKAAEGQHQEILIAFYHSEITPTQMPNGRLYEKDVKKFMKDFPNVHDYQPWNEANRGNIRYASESLDSPTPLAAAKYYKIVRTLCPACAVTGLDILDQPEVGPSLQYVAEFKSAIVHTLHLPVPRLWGLHNYSDTNRFQTGRTRAILASVPGEVWLTETGGIVKFGTDFSNYGGEGLTRAANALSFMFGLVKEFPRLKRLYIYEWTGSGPGAVFDAGLTDYRHRPRPGYVVVCVHLHAKNCKMKVNWD